MKKLMIVVVLLLLISTLLRFNKTYSVYEYIGLAIDKMGITQNTYNIRIDDKIEPYVYLYWVGENGTNDIEKSNQIAY